MTPAAPELAAPARAIVDEMVAHLAATQDQLLTDMLQHVRHVVPEYGSISAPAVRTAVLDGMREVYAIGLDVLGTSDDLSPAQRTRLSAVGGERAAQGIPSSSLSRSFRINISFVFDHIIERLDAVEPSAAKEAATTFLTRRLLWLTDEGCTSMEQAHQEQLARQSRTREQAMGGFIEDLIRGGFQDAGHLRTRAREVDYPVHQAQALSLLTASGSAPDAHRLRGIAVGFCAGRSCSRFVLHDGAPQPYLSIVQPLATPETWPQLHAALAELCAHHRLTAVCAGPRRADELAATHARLRTVIAAASRVFPCAAVSAEQTELLRVFHPDARRLRAFADDHLGAVLASPPRTRTPLLETLRSLVLTTNSDVISAISQELAVHRHSVRNRLDRLRALTGLDPIIERSLLHAAYLAHLLSARPGVDTD